MEIALAEGEPRRTAGVATVDVDDVKAEAERLRDEGVEVGTVLELHGEVRLLDVFDPDGNRIQLVQELRPMIRQSRSRATSASSATCSTTPSTAARCPPARTSSRSTAT